VAAFTGTPEFEDDDRRLFDEVPLCMPVEVGEDVPLLLADDDVDACGWALLLPSIISSLAQTMARLHTMHTSSMAAEGRLDCASRLPVLNPI